MDYKQVIYNYQKTQYSPLEAREALYRAAVAAFEENWTFMDTSFQLGDKALEDGLDKETIEYTIRRAFSQEKRMGEREDNIPKSGQSLDFDEESRELLKSQHIDPDALAIPWPADDWRKDLVKLIDAAFQPGDIIEFKVAETPNTHQEPIENITSQKDKINKIMRNLDGDDGALITINAINSTSASDESWKYRYAVVDSNRMDLSKQLAFYKALNLPCVALVNSGANTVQAWVKIEATDVTEYTERIDFLYSTLEEHGFKTDPTLKNHSQMVRMPGVLRQGKQQYLIGLNEGAQNWDEWREWVNFSLDGNPMVELASYHSHAPAPENILIDGMLSTGQFLALVGPPKSGKSLSLINMALSLAQGGEWLGYHSSASDVLYINFDLSKNAFINRIHQVAIATELDPNSVKLGLIHLRGYDFTPDEMADFLVRRIKGAQKYEQHNYKAVVIDPIGHAMQEATATTIKQMVDKVISATGSSIITAFSTADFITGNYQPDGLLKLNSNTDDNSFSLTGLFKEFANFTDKKIFWNYPRFELQS